MSRTFSVRAFKGTGDNRQVLENLDLTVPDPGTGHTQAMVGVLSETVGVAQFTDVNTTGTYTMQGVLPAGAIVLASKVGPIVGFAGDTSAVLTIGDGSDVDRYNTGTVNVFVTQAVGVDAGLPSGLKLLTADNHPKLTITSAADFSDVVTDGNGEVTVSIYYIPPAA